MQRRFFLLLLPSLLLAALPFVGGCGSGGPKEALWPQKPGPKVVVTFAPYYSIVSKVMGDKGTVQSLLTSQGPHHADTNIATKNLIEEADVLFINGLGLDDRLGYKLKKDSSNSNLSLVNLSENLDRDKLLEGGCSCCDDDHHDHKHPHAHGQAKDSPGYDPHIWLDPKRMIPIVERIRDTLKNIAKEFAPEYDANAAKFIAELEKLYQDGRDMFRDCKNKKLVTVHDSLAYFADSFRLKITGIVQKAPGQDPNPKELAELIDKCKKEGVRIIAVEPQYTSRGTVDTLKQELVKAGVNDPQIIELDTLETATKEEMTPDWYTSKLRKNLEAIQKVMK
jgi:zinc transport system substrate-binding protein